MSVGYLEPTNTKKKRGDGYVNKRHPMTLSKALGIFGHEQWSSLDKGKFSLQARRTSFFVDFLRAKRV